jgi:hypothetical protein
MLLCDALITNSEEVVVLVSLVVAVQQPEAAQLNPKNGFDFSTSSSQVCTMNTL